MLHALLWYGFIVLKMQEQDRLDWSQPGWLRRIPANENASYLKYLGASEVDLQRSKDQDLKLGKTPSSKAGALVAELFSFVT